MALLSEHGQPEELAGLFERRYGEAVRHVADVDAVYLREQQRCGFKSCLIATSICKNGPTPSGSCPPEAGVHLEQ